MKLRSLAVNQFKKFTSPTRLDGIDDGLNVIVGPNELGKSTLLDALRAVLFEKYSSKAQAITALQNDRNQAGPVVELVFELDDGLYGITKRFIKKPYARLSCPDGRTLEGDAAEDTLRNLWGFDEPGKTGAKPETLGMWNVLWVQQGQSFGALDLPDSARSRVMFRSCVWGLSEKRRILNPSVVTQRIHLPEPGKGGYALKKDTVVSIDEPTAPKDALTDVLREGAQNLLVQAVTAELEELLEEYALQQDGAGRQRVVRNGFLPRREIQTGLGAVSIQIPRVRDRGIEHGTEEAVRFHSCLVPPYLKRSKSLDELLPLLYLKGISSGDFSEALSALLGPDAPGLSANTISRLKQKWVVDYEKWSRRDLSHKRHVYWWVDGVYANVRFDDARLCLLVIMGATADGKKELIAVEDGYRESEQSWREVLRSLRARGLTFEPKLAVGDGASDLLTSGIASLARQEAYFFVRPQVTSV